MPTVSPTPELPRKGEPRQTPRTHKKGSTRWAQDTEGPPSRTSVGGSRRLREPSDSVCTCAGPHSASREKAAPRTGKSVPRAVRAQGRDGRLVRFCLLSGASARVTFITGGQCPSCSNSYIVEAWGWSLVIAAMLARACSKPSGLGFVCEPGTESAQVSIKGRPEFSSASS